MLSLELDSMALVGPFQLRMLRDSVPGISKHTVELVPLWCCSCGVGHTNIKYFYNNNSDFTAFVCFFLLSSCMSVLTNTPPVYTCTRQSHNSVLVYKIPLRFPVPIHWFIQKWSAHLLHFQWTNWNSIFSVSLCPYELSVVLKSSCK